MTHIYSIAYLRQVAGFILNHQLSWSDESAKEFRANFGLSERSVLSLWNQLVDRNPNKLLPAKAKLKHLLWALLYLKVYATETVLSRMAKTTRKTFRIWVAKILDAIFGLVPRKIRWENRFRGDQGKQCKSTVDATNFRIQQLRPWSKKWYSHKFKGPGVRYEVAICIQTGDIVWINGPYPCGAWPDMKIFRHRLFYRIPPGERVEGDAGYRGAPNHIRTPAMAVSLADRRAKRRAAQRHETVNRRFKQWGVLKQAYRHNIDRHGVHFGCVAVCTQIAFENGEPLFETTY